MSEKPRSKIIIDLFGPDCHVQLTGAARLRLIEERKAERAKLYRMFGLEPPDDAN